MSQFISLPILASLRAAERLEAREAAHRETYLETVAPPQPQPVKVRRDEAKRTKRSLPS